MALSTLRHKVNVNSLSVSRIPFSRTVWNQFDELGLLASLTRNKDETNWEYKRRIHDSFSNLANSTYRGLVFGITRELGLSLFSPIKVNPRRDSQGAFLATDPYIIFDGAFLLLYSDYKNNQLDWKIDRYEPGGNYEHLQRMVDFINSTVFFEAELLGNVNPYTRSMTILNQSNRFAIVNEEVQASTKFQLEHGHIVNGSLQFNNSLSLKRSRSVAEDVVLPGDYHVDYLTGVVTFGSMPDPILSVSYQYTEYPFKPVASPVILCDINADNFKSKMFEQILMDNGHYAHGLPRELAVDIINELMSVVPMMWGI